MPGLSREVEKRSSTSVGVRVKRSRGMATLTIPAALLAGSAAVRTRSPSTMTATLRLLARRTRKRMKPGGSSGSSSPPPPWSMGTRSERRALMSAQESPWRVSLRSGAAP